MENKIRILFVHHAASWGGAPNSMIKTINALDKNKYEAIVFLIKDSIVRKKLEENGINYIIAKSLFYKNFYNFYLHWLPYYIPFYNFPKFLKLSLYWLLSRYIFAKRELKNIDFNIAHLNSSQITDWLAPCKAKGKVIMHVREPLTKGSFGIRYAFFKYQMKKYTDKIIAISNDNAQRVGLPYKTEVVYNFSESINVLPNPESYYSKKVLYLGGASESKGFYTMVEALPYLDSGIIVYFGGNYNSKTENTLKFKIKKLLGYGKRQRIAIDKMRQSVNAIEIGVVFNTSDYFNDSCCLVSPFASSHFARPVIEAYLHKKPAIGTDVEGMDEIIEHNKTGLIVKNYDGKALAEAINFLVSNPHTSQSMGEQAYKLALTMFTSKNIKQIMDIYDSMV